MRGKGLIFESLRGSSEALQDWGCVIIDQNCHSGRAERFWARPGISENHVKSNHSGSRLASRLAGFGRDDELRDSLIGVRVSH
jgi:hypothetical protein